MSVMMQRFERIAQMVPPCQTAADIGCDHGKLSALLLQRKRCEKVIAADVSAFSVEKTKKLAEKLHLSQVIEVRQGSGFSVLGEGEAQAAVLAGLGGELIAQLIETEKEKAAALRLVMQPMQQGEKLRRYLRENGWSIVREEMVEEGGRIHEMLLAERGAYPPRPPEVSEALWDEMGPLLWERKEPLLAKRLRYKAESVGRRLRETARGESALAREGERQLKEQIAQYEWAIEQIEKENRGWPT